MDTLPPLEIAKPIKDSIIKMVKPLGVSHTQILIEQGDIVVLSDSGKKCRLILKSKITNATPNIQTLPPFHSLVCHN